MFNISAILSNSGNTTLSLSVFSLFSSFSTISASASTLLSSLEVFEFTKASISIISLLTEFSLVLFTNIFAVVFKIPSELVDVR